MIEQVSLFIERYSVGLGIDRHIERTRHDYVVARFGLPTELKPLLGTVKWLSGYVGPVPSVRGVSAHIAHARLVLVENVLIRECGGDQSPVGPARVEPMRS